MFLFINAVWLEWAPAHFAFSGDAIARAHTRCGLSQTSVTLMKHAFKSVLYVDDAIFVEVNVPERLFSTTYCWEYLVRGALGPDSINTDKLEEEGTWESRQILLGFVVDLNSM